MKLQVQGDFLNMILNGKICLLSPVLFNIVEKVLFHAINQLKEILNKNNEKGRKYITIHFTHSRYYADIQNYTIRYNPYRDNLTIST